jgi:cobalt-zinc-cadmium efflux system membrane fusion protein
MMNDISKVITPVLLALCLLSACKEVSEESEAVNNPKVTGESVHFPAKSSTIKRLQTAPVVAAQNSVLRVPGRIVWDEDHTSHLIPPVSGRFIDVPKAGVLGATIKENETLAYVLSPELGAAQADAATARAALVQSEKNYARVNELIADNGVSTKDLELANTDVERARAEATRTALRLKLLGIQSSTVDQRYPVRSPISGVIVERHTNPGMEWRPDQASSPLFTITDPTYLWCYIDVPEHSLDQLHTGLNVTLHSNAWPQESFEAVIDSVGDSVDVASRTIKVRAHLRNLNRHLKNEMYVTANLVGDVHGSYDVPAKAVFLNNNEQQVFVKTGEGIYLRKTIIPVASNEQWVSISQGLNKGDEVVVDGALYLEKILEAGAAHTALDKPRL